MNQSTNKAGARDLASNDMHEIQKHILKKLSLAKKCKYSELKPQATESNKFAYHLQSLISAGLVSAKSGSIKEAKDDGYALTPKGKHYVDTISFESFKPRIQPKIVTLLVLENKPSAAGGTSKGKSTGKVGAKNEPMYLLYKRRKSPFINHIGFPYGKIHLEERIYEAAERELKEKTGLNAKLVHKGDVYLTVHDETELVSHMLCHVFAASNPSGILKTGDPTGECFWAKLSDIPPRQLIPGVLQIEKLLKNGKGKSGSKGSASKSHGGNERFFAEFFLNTTDED